MTMKTLTSRADIETLVAAFYTKIKVDPLLGEIFNRHIAEDQWPRHLAHLADFWETNLFGIPKFKGSPTAKHIQVDRNLNHSIKPEHFGQWLHLWFETVDELFMGEYAERAKNAARKMSTGQYLMIWQHRSENSTLG
jgi:hemoglobin